MGFQIATNRQNWTGRYFWESWWRWRELFCFVAIQNATHPFRKGTSKINRNNVELFLRRLTHFSMFVSTIRPNYKAYLFPSEADQILDKNAGRRYFGKTFGSNIGEKGWVSKYQISKYQKFIIPKFGIFQNTKKVRSKYQKGRSKYQPQRWYDNLNSEPTILN